jgi:hypothetical protein
MTCVTDVGRHPGGQARPAYSQRTRRSSVFFPPCTPFVKQLGHCPPLFTSTVRGGGNPRTTVLPRTAHCLTHPRELSSLARVERLASNPRSLSLSLLSLLFPPLSHALRARTTTDDPSGACRSTDRASSSESGAGFCRAPPPGEPKPELALQPGQDLPTSLPLCASSVGTAKCHTSQRVSHFRGAPSVFILLGI